MNTETKTNGSYPASVNNRMALPPFTDVHQDEHGWFLVADLPGVAADKLTLTVEDGRLLVVGKRQAPLDAQTEQELRRAFTLPDEVDTDAISAKLVDGVLEVTLPKRAELKPKRITVASA
jgi:HSP20 family protein